MMYISHQYYLAMFEHGFTSLQCSDIKITENILKIKT